MTKQQYERLSAPFRGEGTRKVLAALNSGLTYLCYAIYPLLLVYLAVMRDGRVLRALVVPGVAFVLLTVVRKKLNYPRPYQVLEITPILHKSTQGKSMPSRHIFCAFMIAMTFLWIFPVIGVVLLVLGVVMAVIRVIAGIHFPRDVLVGALVGLLFGLVGYWGLG